MIWKTPHINKVYEALSAIADNRLKLISDTEATLISTSGGKSYTISYDPVVGAMMCNDNYAYWTDKLSYPMIAFLFTTHKIEYDNKYLPYLANIKWKDINQKFKNDFDKSLDFVLSDLEQKGYPVADLKLAANKIYTQICDLKINQLGPKTKPSDSY